MSPTLVNAAVADARAELLDLGGREATVIAAGIEALPSERAFQVMASASQAARPQWARRSGLRGAAELCDVYCRKSSEMRFTEAAFSVAKTVLPSDLAM